MEEPKDILAHKAGVAAFKAFRHYNLLNSLADGDILKWKAILNEPYQYILTKQLMRITQARFDKRYEALIKVKK